MRATGVIEKLVTDTKPLIKNSNDILKHHLDPSTQIVIIRHADKLPQKNTGEALSAKGSDAVDELCLLLLKTIWQPRCCDCHQSHRQP